MLPTKNDMVMLSRLLRKVARELDKIAQHWDLIQTNYPQAPAKSKKFTKGKTIGFHNKHKWDDDKVRKFLEDYMEEDSDIEALTKKYGRTRGSLTGLFYGIKTGKRKLPSDMADLQERVRRFKR